MNGGFTIRPIAAAQPSPAATVVLLRPGPDGLEVLLTHRPASMAFAGGAHVFPGGRLEPGDSVPDHPLAGGLTPTGAAERLAGTLEPAAAFAHHMAAVRETLEETGISISADALIPLSRWVTPRSLRTRFDARFFAALVPPATVVTVESKEVSSARWMTTAAALAAAAAGEIALLQPTHVTLLQLGGLATGDAVASAFAPGASFDPPSVGPDQGGCAAIEQRWAGGIAGRRATGWLIGDRHLVLVDPGDPTAVTGAAVEAAMRDRGARIVGIALTGTEPERMAGVELYATGLGLPVAGGAGFGSRVLFPVIEVQDGAVLPFGDRPLRLAETIDGHVGWLLSDGRMLGPDSLAD